MPRVTRYIGLIVLLFGIPGILTAQYQNVQISGEESYDPEEVTIAINPTNRMNLAAGANLDYIYYSTDGGYSWVGGRMTSDAFGVWGDPCVIFDVEGNLYYSHLSNPPDSIGYWIDRIVVQKSTDGGLTWNDGSAAGFNPPANQDKEWMGTDLTNSPYRGNLYLAWTEFDEYDSSNPADSSRILFSRSTDQGETWSEPVRVSDQGGNCLDSDDTVEGAVPAVGPNGEIYTSWSGPEGIMFDRSMDGGVTFGEDIFVDPQPGGWDFNVTGIYRCDGFSVTASDISHSPYRGNVYICWSDQRNGTDDTDVFFITSTDGGANWGEVVRVNNDTGTRHQFFNWMTVDPVSGIIYVVFYDRRETSGVATDVFVAKSEDGGETFTNFRVSESSFTPDHYVFFGDYINVAAFNGKIYPVWTRLDNYNLSVWTAIIEEPVGVGSPPGRSIPRSFTLAQNYPNPFNPSTTIGYSIPAGDAVHVELKIYDLRGQLVRSLMEREEEPGQYSVHWDGKNDHRQTVGSGVYLYRLKAGPLASTKKMILTR